MMRTARDRAACCVTTLLIVVVAGGCGGSGDDSPADSPKSRSPAAGKSALLKSPAAGKSKGPAASREVTKSNAAPVNAKARATQNVAQPRPAKKKPKPQTVYRRSDNRPRHDDAKLAQLGIRRYASKRAILYTDIDPAVAAQLPTYIDQAYAAWVKYFGPLPPNREGTEFQVTGYIMKDESQFKQAGLVPVRLPPFLVGRHWENRFWMYQQKWAYFTRHTMIHEATHCFMYALRDLRFSVWYMEGMADYFGTHWRDEKGVTHFGVMPPDPRDFRGFARIDFVQRYVKAGKPWSIRRVRQLVADDTGHKEPYAYAWSWALCKFLDGHPKYRKRFRELGGVLTSLRFQYEMGQFLKSHAPHIDTEWALFIRGLDYGYDLERAAIDFAAGRPLTTANPVKSFDLATNRGWQSSKVRLEKGKTYRVTATGKFIIAEKPKPWVCEPQGVSIRYTDGKPLGMVVGMIVPEKPSADAASAEAPPVIPIGRGRTFTAAETGTLYVRVNDFWSQLENNTGELKVRVETAKP